MCSLVPESGLQKTDSRKDVKQKDFGARIGWCDRQLMRCQSLAVGGQPDVGHGVTFHFCAKSNKNTPD